MLAEILTRIALYSAGAAFLAGLLVAVLTGSGRNIKILLAVATAIFVLAVAAGMILTRGLAVLLLFQLIIAFMMLCLLVVIGAACGAGLHLLLHKKRRNTRLSDAERTEFLPLADFAAQEGISEERALSRIKTGYYRAGLYQGIWHIHQTELSHHRNTPGVVLEPVKSKGKHSVGSQPDAADK